MNAFKLPVNCVRKCKVMKKNLIRKKRYFYAMAVVLAMACLSACSVSPSYIKKKTGEQQIPAEESVEEEILTKTDTTAPEGILKSYFLIASETVVPGDFLESVTDDSEFTEGFRNAKLIYEEARVKELFQQGMENQETTQLDMDANELFGLDWKAEKDCYEDQQVSEESLEETFSPVEDGLYELEVAAVDAHGNASVSKVYVLYSGAMLVLAEGEELELPTIPEVVLETPAPAVTAESEPEQSAQINGFDRGKAEEAFSKVNAERLANGVHELAWDESLYELACIRAQEIVSGFSHQRPDGSYVGDVIIRQYGATGCGENIASDYTLTTNLINGWLNSQGHKENMMNSRFTAGVMACYCHNGSYYWVNLFKQ